MVQKPIQCCSEKPAYLVTYSVSGSEKDYLVCLSCLQKKYFAKYIIRKIPITNTYRKKFQNENFDEGDEHKIVNENFTENFDENESFVTGESS